MGQEATHCTSLCGVEWMMCGVEWMVCCAWGVCADDGVWQQGQCTHAFDHELTICCPCVECIPYKWYWNTSPLPNINPTQNKHAKQNKTHKQTPPKHHPPLGCCHQQVASSGSECHLPLVHPPPVQSPQCCHHHHSRGAHGTHAL